MTVPEVPNHHRAEEPAPAAANDLGWLRLQRGVAVGMVLTFVAVLLLVPALLDVPLAPAALFAVALALTWWRPRGAAIAIGVLATLWLVSQVVTIGALLPDLARPQDTAVFVVTVAMLIVPTAGVIGLVGMLRRSSGHVATIALRGTGLVLVAGALVGLVAGAVVQDTPPPVSEAPTVTLAGNAFEPEEVTIRAGDSVTWLWDDGDVQHDVVADTFGSDIQADGTYTHAFQEPGAYAYRCTLHPRMTGTVTVIATDAATS